MLNTTLSLLCCPRWNKKPTKRNLAAKNLAAKNLAEKNLRCGGPLELTDSSPPLSCHKSPRSPDSKGVFEVTTGELKCSVCGFRFPILGGVAVVVADVRDYLLSHVKGIAQVVPDSDIPREYRREFLEAKAEIQLEHIEEDLEAERVNALYLMNHYLRVSDLSPSLGKPWWQSEVGTSSDLIDKLIREYWDQGPFAKIGTWLAELDTQSSPVHKVVELGCGVGGLYLTLKPYLHSYLGAYLGVDSSFASIAIARHLLLGAPGPQGGLRIPADLLAGSVSRPIYLNSHALPQDRVGSSKTSDQKADFIVGDLSNLPLREGQYDLAVALNAIDMLDQPSQLPELKYRLLKKNGITVQSSPYIWHEAVASQLRKKVPKAIGSSAKAVEWLYEQAGFKVEKMCEHLPWLFFKNVRQMEVYSVQIFLARKIPL